jgi:uncharacterized membrane protein YcaP (DUF421 family)
VRRRILRRRRQLGPVLLVELIGISPWEKIGRTIAIYLALVALLRVSGKRELAQLNSLDLVVLLLLSNVVQNAVIGDDLTVLGGVLGAAVLVAFNYLVVRFAFFHPRFGRRLRGRAAVLVVDGELRRDELRRELLTPAQLEVALRRQGYDGLESVDSAQLEPEGVVLAAEKPAATLDDVLERLDRIESRLASTS